MKKLTSLFHAVLFTNLLFAQAYLDIKVPVQQVFKETFTDNAGNWPQHKSDTAEILLTQQGYLQRASLIDIFLPRPAKADLRKSTNYYNLRVETTSIENSAAFFGMAFGIKNKGNYHAFLINGLGEFVIREVKEGKVKDFVKEKSEKINTGKGAKNILGIETSLGFLGYVVNYFVNGSNIQARTAVEQQMEEAKKKNNDNSAADIEKEINAMQAASLDALGAGLGFLTLKTAAVLYDNFDLQIIANEGDLKMYNNQWQPNISDISYLKKPLQKELIDAQNNYANNLKKSAADKLALATKAVAEMAADKLIPPGADGKKFTPDVQAVIWLKTIIFDVGYDDPLFFNPEKNLISDDGNVRKYEVRQRLPNIRFIPTVTVDTKGKSAMLVMILGEKLSEADLRNLLGQYLVNLYAAAGPAVAKYLDPKPADKDLHTIGVSTGGKSIISDRSTVLALSPTKNTDGSWELKLIISAK